MEAVAVLEQQRAAVASLPMATLGPTQQRAAFPSKTEVMVELRPSGAVVAVQTPTVDLVAVVQVLIPTGTAAAVADILAVAVVLGMAVLPDMVAAAALSIVEPTRAIRRVPTRARGR